MSARKTLLSLVVFLALLAIYLVDAHRLDRERTRREQSERLFTFEVANITKVALHNAEGDFLLERRDGEWWLAAPIESRADVDQVDPMLRNLQGAKKRNSFDPKGSLAEYGLDKPSVWVEVTGDEDGKSKTVRILYGETAAQTYQVYGRIAGESDIFTLSDYSKTQCQKSLLNLRDKTILSAKPEEIVRVEVARQGQATLDLSRPSAKSERWGLAPSGAAADRDAVDNLLRTLHNTRATQILDSPTSPSTFFGATPELARATVTVHTAAPHVLFVGKNTSSGGGEIYARLEGDSRIFVVRESFLSDLDKKPADLRDKGLVDIDPGDVAAILIRSDRDPVKIERASTAADWSFADAKHPPASQEKTNRLLGDLTSLKAKEFMADAAEATPEKLAAWGLDSPDVEVRVRAFDNPSTGGFDRGDIDVDKGVVYIRRLSDGAVLALDFKRVGDFNKYREDLEDRTFVDFNPDDVAQIQVAGQSPQGPLRYDFIRRTSSWSSKAADGRKVTLQPYDVTTFLNDVRELEYVDRFTPAPDDATRGGLAEPALKIDLLDKSGDLLATLSYGERRGFRQIMGSRSGAYVVDLTNTDRLTRSLHTLQLKVEKSESEDLPGGDTPEGSSASGAS